MTANTQKIDCQEKNSMKKLPASGAISGEMPRSRKVSARSCAARGPV